MFCLAREMRLGLIQWWRRLQHSVQVLHRQPDPRVLDLQRTAKQWLVLCPRGHTLRRGKRTATHMIRLLISPTCRSLPSYISIACRLKSPANGKSILRGDQQSSTVRVCLHATTGHLFLWRKPTRPSRPWLPRSLPPW